MAFTVLYDACVLHPAPVRDLLIRIANTRVVRARWSERILDECFASILRDFPDHVLARYDVEAKHPDEFVLDTIDLAPAAVARCVTQQAAACRTPPVTLPALLHALRDAGLVRSAARLQEQFGPAVFQAPPER